MPLKDAFNGLDSNKVNGSVLRVYNGCFYTYYDFAQRVMYSGQASIPFSQLDRESLIEARDKLIELKGTPPELPPEAPATQAPVRKFNL
ncbi:MAG: hypothetical protein EPN97_13960 [Alphaproteobacteria bacterium]|nr:MAG: hypothetical protein EPN97_13960 [Alphaproteobacteria bacterium]